jgi:hypothetical protein
MIIKWISRFANRPAVSSAPAVNPVQQASPLFNQTPDEPEPFGFKVSWFAVKASNPAAVLDALELADATPANWKSGLAAVYSRQKDGRWAFISPPISGWVFAVSTSWPYPVAIEAEYQTEYQHDIGRRFDLLFSRLMKKFDDVQFLGSHRVVDFVVWARALNGKPRRIFAHADGEVLANFGEQAPEEVKLGFANLSGLSPSDATDRIFEVAEEQDAEADGLVANGLSRREALAKVRENGRHAMPDEKDVIDLAALWSIDPLRLESQKHPVGLGLAARLPKDLAQ